MKTLAARLTVVASRVACLFAAALILPATSSAAGQSEQLRFEGTDAFRFILRDLGFTPLQGRQQLRDQPRQTLLIVVGRVTANRLDPHAPIRPEDIRSALLRSALRGFVEQGGAVLVATNQATGEALEDAFQIRVTGKLLVASDPGRAYQGNGNCPLIKPFDRNHPIFRGLTQVATNRPSHLEGQGPWAAGLPPVLGARIVKELPFAKVVDQENQGRGRAIILSDDGVFMNGMMLVRQGNDNIHFAYNCLEWLKADHRSYALFIEDGRIIGDFKTQIGAIPETGLPPLDDRLMPTVALVDDLLARLEDENMFNRLILNAVPANELLTGLALGLTFVLIALGLFRLAQARHRVDVEAPLYATAVSRYVPALAVVEQRHQAVLQDGNLWEAARDLARQCFEPLGGLSSVLAAQTLHPASGTLDLPRVTVTGAWWRRWILHSHVRRLWELAYGSHVSRISAREFARLAGWCQEVRAALANGSLQLDLPTKT